MMIAIAALKERSEILDSFQVAHIPVAGVKIDSIVASCRVDQRVPEMEAVLKAQVCRFNRQRLVQINDSCLAQGSDHLQRDMLSPDLFDPPLLLVDTPHNHQ